MNSDIAALTEANGHSVHPVAEHGPPVRDDWLRTASIEISPLEIGQANAIARYLSPGTQTFIPWLPQSRPEELVHASAVLRGCGLNPVPHIAARRIKSAAQGQDLFRRLAVEARVDSVLLIGGDLTQAAGPFDSALSLLQTGMAESAGIRRIGISAYPEGHPAITVAVLQQQLEKKLEYLHSKNFSAFIVSQFCFESQAILQWLEGLRQCGIADPVRIGLAGPTRLRKLLAMGLRCGVGASLRAIKGKSGMVEALISNHGPDGIIAELEHGMTLARYDAALHLFAFGGAEETARWLTGTRSRAL